MLWRAKAGNGVWVVTNTEGNAWDMADFANKVIKPALRKAKVEWKGFHSGRRGLGTELRSLTGNSTAARDVLGHSRTQVTEEHYESRLPEDALRGLKLLEAKSFSK